MGNREPKCVAEGTKYKTVCKSNTADPVWNESVVIPNVLYLDTKLVVTVFNKRAMGRDQCLGKVEVPLGSPSLMRDGPPEDMVLTLKDAEQRLDMVIGGELLLRLQFKA
ncbi:unnamed protein product [Discosporangium mesarthrocarpum]